MVREKEIFDILIVKSAQGVKLNGYSLGKLRKISLCI